MNKSPYKGDAISDARLSTHYDDNKPFELTQTENRLDNLSSNLNIEISLASDDILKLERLQERYYKHCAASKADNDMGCYIQYLNAYERVNALVEARYAPFRPVLDDGKQNVGQ